MSSGSQFNDSKHNDTKYNDTSNHLGNKRFLIVSCIGDNSLHKHWIDNAELRNFDLFLSYYGDEKNKFENDCDYFIKQKGLKWNCIHKIVKKYLNIFCSYDAVWFPDDDIITNTENINKMFDAFTQHNLSLAQPALTHDSYYVHAITIQSTGFLIRYTNFVEVMAPIFSRKTLLECVESFGKSESGWFLDSAWYSLVKDKDRIGIIDATPVKHTRPVLGGNLYKNLANSPFKDFYTLNKYYVARPHSFHHRIYNGLWINNMPNYEAHSIPLDVNLCLMLILGAPNLVFNTYGFINMFILPNIIAYQSKDVDIGMFDSLDQDEDLTQLFVSLAESFDLQLLCKLNDLRKSKHEIILEAEIKNNNFIGSTLHQVLLYLRDMNNFNFLSREQIQNIVCFLNRLGEKESELKYLSFLEKIGVII